MADGYRRCTVCEAGGTYEQAAEVARVRCNVRAFADREFTVWRCPGCRSLHALEDIDYGEYYAAYPLVRQRLDFFTLRLYGSRLALLERAGLRPSDRVLDYGCGNGAFVRYLRARGFPHAQGFDPIVPGWGDRSVLAVPFDVVTAQDVIEHAPDPDAFLGELASLLNEGGMLALGTPDAGGIDLHGALDAVGQLHQPYHRHLLTGPQLVHMMEVRGLQVESAVSRWYVDTWFPFCNSSFILRYWAAAGGFVDASFEGVRWSLFLRRPSLIVHALLGRAWSPRKDVVLFARRARTASELAGDANVGVTQERQRGRAPVA